MLTFEDGFETESTVDSLKLCDYLHFLLWKNPFLNFISWNENFIGNIFCRSGFSPHVPVKSFMLFKARIAWSTRRGHETHFFSVAWHEFYTRLIIKAAGLSLRLQPVKSGLHTLLYQFHQFPKEQKDFPYHIERKKKLSTQLLCVFKLMKSLNIFTGKLIFIELFN